MIFAYPLGKKGVKTSGYGKRGGGQHRGVDIGIPVGTDVISIADGTVVRSDIADRTGYGNFICIEHQNIFNKKKYSCYAHLSDRLKEVGDQVKKGDVIGKSGGAKGALGSGMSTGPHLHFELRNTLRGDWENPESLILQSKVGDKSKGTEDITKITRNAESEKFFKSSPIQIISTPENHKKRSTGKWPNKNAYDIKAPIGTDLYSITAGRVTNKKETSNKKGNVFGTQLSVEGIDGFPDAFYAHIDSVKLNIGDVVYPGDYIGKVTKWPKYPNQSHVHISVNDTHDVFDFMDKSGNLKNTKNEFNVDDLLSKDNLSDLIPKSFFSTIKTTLDKIKGGMFENDHQITEDVTRIKDIMKKIL
jgi:murein DD-endopeptidase MepM/ murein hydrolase activator NlpD